MNTFGPSATTQYPLVDPRSVRENRARFRRDMLPLLERANSFYIPSGRLASRGWILLDRNSYNNINTYSNTLQLVIGDPRQPDNVATLRNLSIVQAQCVTRGLSSDANAIYLIELTDNRGILHNRWFQAPITTNYNIRAPAYPQTFYINSMNKNVLASNQPPPPTTTWTWETMLHDMWNQMNAINNKTLLGAWPGMPANYTISGTPEGFWFAGRPIWYSFNDILEHLGLTIACDLTQVNNPYTIVVLGAADTTFTTTQNKYGTITSTFYRLEDDQEWIDTGSGRVPATVTVLFRRRNSVYGTEETEPYQNDTPAQRACQWSMIPIYSVTVNAPSTFSSAVGTHYLWSDFTVRYDMNSGPSGELGASGLTDVVMANLIAQERVTQYFGKVYRQTLGYMTQTYTGALPFATGSQVDGVCYYQDYKSQDRQVWKTKITRGAYPPFSDVWDEEYDKSK